MKSQSGFSLIELVVVIVLLAVLSVTAAPRFLNVQDDARVSTFRSLKASFSTAVTLFNSKWLVDGGPNPNIKEGREGNWGYKIYDLHFNKYGYPRLISGTQECQDILENLLPDSNLTRDDYEVKESSESKGSSDENSASGNICIYKFNSAPFSLIYHELDGRVELIERDTI